MMNIYIIFIDFLEQERMRKVAGTIKSIRAKQYDESPVQFTRMSANMAMAISPQKPTTRPMRVNENPHVKRIASKARAKGKPISIPRMPHMTLKKLERLQEFNELDAVQLVGTLLKIRKIKVNRQRIILVLFVQSSLFYSKDSFIFIASLDYINILIALIGSFKKIRKHEQIFVIRHQSFNSIFLDLSILNENYYNIMAQIQPFQSDKVLTRTLFNNFGKLLVFTFYSQANPKSIELRTNLETTIPIFGDHQNVKYYFISQQSSPDTFKKYQITETPTVLFTQTDKKVLKKITTDDVGSIFDALSQEIVAFREHFQKDKGVWHPKIKSILNQSQVIIFIKGTAENPKCGFTQTLLKLLQDQDISFTYYDIIADEQMRYWLRNYGGWPTYPQVYSNGKLIGGLDVCKELVAKGELIGRVSKNTRLAAAGDKLKELLAQYRYLVLTQDFSYKDQLAQDLLSKIRVQYPNEQLKVFNASLDEPLSKALKQSFNKELPLFFIEGAVQTI